MVKYVDNIISFNEVPHEISLCINISGCPNHCQGCHSSYLSEDIGEVLNKESLEALIKQNEGITCVCLMGGDQAPNTINWLLMCIKELHPNLKTCWYSGRQKWANEVSPEYLDFIKLGPYIEERGPLTNPNTNQVFKAKGKHLYKISAYPDEWYDVTNWFWENGIG